LFHFVLCFAKQEKWCEMETLLPYFVYSDAHIDRY
jgi:hypothetical protein